MTKPNIEREARNIIELQLSDAQCRYLLMNLLGRLQSGSNSEPELARKLKAACLEAIRECE